MKIVAGVVLFNPDVDRLIENLCAIGSQVDCILLINNGSPDIIPMLKKRIGNYCADLHIVNNKSNLGMAVALNQILEYARDNGLDWFISLDQDSIAPPNMVRDYKVIMKRTGVGIICPQVCDINNQTSEHLNENIESIYNEEDVITSGSCINVRAALNIGGFDERLFIDFVDTDFQKRILLAGYQIIRNNDVILTHEVGKIKVIDFLGHRIICTNHNAVRRYYQVRNRLYFKKKYYGNIAVIIEKIRLILGTLKIAAFEEDRINKIIATINAFKNYKKLLYGDYASRIRNMKITLVLPAVYGTGGIKVVYEYARRLKRRGYDVTVYVPIKAYNMHRGKCHVDFLKQIYATFKVLKSVFVDKLPQKVGKENDVKIKAVWKIADGFLQDADVIIATAWCTAYDINKLKISKGKKLYFVQGYEIWDNLDYGMNSYRLPLKKIAIATWIKEKLITECGCGEDDIEIVNNGIDTKKYFLSEEKDVNKNKEATISCLMLDHTLEKKGVKYGIAAFMAAKKAVPNLRLKMFGIKKSKYVPDGIDYYKDPNQDELVKLYQQSDIFIFPSLEEGWGLTPIEAMACGCAVVATNVGCMLDIGVNNENVVLSDCANVGSLADGIIKLAQNTEFRNKIAMNGYKTVQMLDWDRATDKFEKIILETVT